MPVNALGPCTLGFAEADSAQLPATFMTDQLSNDLASLRIDRDAERAPRRFPGWLVGLLVVALLGAGGYFLALPRLEAQVFKTEVAFTEIALVSPAEAQITLTATGYVVPQRTSTVGSKVPGTVEKVFVAQGDVVKEGDVLAELDPRDENAAINAARSRAAAAMARAKSALAGAETRAAELHEAKQKAERERRLANQGASALGNAEDLEARVASMQQAVAAEQAVAKAAAAEANALGAEVQALKVGKGHLTIVAPIGGTVMNKPPQLGEYIGPQPPGISVDMGGFELADFSSNVVETDVPEGRLHLVEVGGPAEIVLDAYPSRRFRGKVREITPEVDRAKATVMVRVEFVDASQGVLPQMSARVSFLSKALDPEKVKEPPKKVLPNSALAERAGAKVVFVAEGDQVRMRPVKVGSPFGTGFVLLDGPSPGTKVVSSPSPTLADGQRIKEQEE